MKKLNKILCLLLMIVTIGFFSACKSEGTPPLSNNDSGLSSGSGESSEDGSSDETPEVYVPYTSSEIMVVGSDFVSDFFGSFENDVNNASDFNGNIGEMKVLFLNTSKMINAISELDGIIYGACVSGNELSLEDFGGKPNKVAKFYATFSNENDDGDSSVRLRFLFSYDSLDVGLNYDFYDILIVTNKKQGIVSCDISIERSTEKTGMDDSTAKYYNIELDGAIGGGDEESVLFDVYQFERTEMIETQTEVNYNNIDNFKQSYYFGDLKTYVGAEDAELLLRTPTSDQSVLVANKVGGLNQGLKKLSGGVMGTISGLSEGLVKYVDSENLQ